MTTKLSMIVAALCFLPAAIAFTGHRHFARPSSALSATRKPIIAGNWKMNPRSREEAEELAKCAAEATQAGTPGDVILCVPHPYMETVQRAIAGTKVKMAAQGIFFEDSGAFTGSVSSCMVKSMGCEYVLAGHSERRTIFRDDDSSINRKVRKALNNGLKVILCCGESFEEYNSGLADVVCRIELAKDLKGVTKEELKNIVIAYEPCWAIGTGLTCDPATAQKVHKGIRLWFAGKYGFEAAEQIQIQYGGSVTPETVGELMKMSDIDGCLVGGASLDGEKFAKIINYDQ